MEKFKNMCLSGDCCSVRKIAKNVDLRQSVLFFRIVEHCVKFSNSKCCRNSRAKFDTPKHDNVGGVVLGVNSNIQASFRFFSKDKFGFLFVKKMPELYLLHAVICQKISPSLNLAFI